MITVNIMSYKYGHLVAQCVDSIVNQTLKPDIIRVYDDGIGDCKHIKDLYPNVELIEREENMGTAKNFQDALERTETDKVMFIGADNWLRQDTLETLNNVDADIVSYHILITGTEGDEFANKVSAVERHEGYKVWKFRDTVTAKMQDGGNFIHGSVLYNTKLAQEHGYVQMGGDANPQEDWGLFREMMNAGAKYELVDKPFLYYRRHRENFIK